MGLRSARSVMACLPVASPLAQTQGLQNVPNSSELRNSAETYAVYSAILAHPPLSHQDTNTTYAIADTALLSNDKIGTPADACVGIPQVSSANLAQVVSDFEQRRNTPLHLKRSFSLSKPYFLLSPQQTSEFEWWRGGGHIQTDPPSLPEVNPYSGAVDLIRLSGVFFDRPKSVAMVYISATCGTLCGLWGWHVLEKGSPGRWQEIRTARCTATIS
jgi:hypothetical protein